MGDCSAIVDDASELGFTSSNALLPKNNPTTIARQYQLELAKKALEENVIVVLETGCGKTLISILLMNDMSHLIKKPQKNVCVFLAPTVVLVNQQARVIEQYTDFKVGVYCGDAKHLKRHVDWERELEQYEVLVMIPQVLLRSLCHCFIRMEAIALLIFDECHYAQFESNHPYAEIMKVFYDAKVAKVPRIFGMTASPICGKGASINGLQALLDAKVYTVNDKTQLETVVVSPVVQVYHYSSNEKFSSSHQNCLEKLEEIKRQCTSMLCRNGDDPSRIQNSKKLLQRLHNNMVFALTSLGLWGASQACRILLSGDGWERNELIDVKGNSGDEFIQNEYLAQTVSLLDKECKGDVAEGMVDTLSYKLLREPFFSQKVLRLVGILSNFRSRPDMKCIIFVNRITIARSLAYILKQIKILSAWRCNYLVGVHSKRMSRKTMYQILEEFRSGELNLLVATKVGEEGLDIQTCCLVIRFDLPETLASFIQSRGRARMAQSEYVFLVDSKNEREMNLLDSFRKDEDLMTLDIRDRKPNGVIADINQEVYSVGSTGATISSQSSISLLYHYCSKLPHDEFFNPKPALFNVDDAEGIICHIIFPSNAPIHHVVGGPQPSKEAAKKDVCLRACKELHQVGALTDYLLPEQDDISTEDSINLPDSDSTEDEDSPFKLQEMVVPAALKEPWHDVDNHVSLKSYFIRLKPQPHDRQYKEFGLFVKESLPSEAERLNIDLHLAHGRSVLTDLVPSGVAKFNEEEMLLALNFQEICLKIILDRSEFTCGHVPLLKSKVSELDSSVYYLFLPVTVQEDCSISVDWMVIRRCLSSPIFSPLGHLSDTPTQDCHLQLADGPASLNDVLNSLVYVAHRESFFFVSQILTDKNGYSLQGSSTNHIDHLSEKFGIHLAHPRQPLLQAKQLFCLRNLLHDRKKGILESRELDEHFFEIPPELCEIKIIGFSKDIGSSLSLLPSVMHYLENLLVAIELKDMLSKSFAEGGVVSAERVLEALTTEQCHERYSLERLEVLGDAFLKFAVGRHLFLKHEAFDEGQLTRRRSSLVNNSNLCTLAIKNQLQGYIRDQEFDPSRFFALGRPCSVICTEQTESVIHCDSEVNLRTGHDNRQVRCSRNHHWLTKKTIADVVEALVGAYIVESGFQAAIAFLKWFGIQVEFEVSQVCHAWTASSRFMALADCISISDIEGILGHHFAHKGLILQALVHPSYNRHGGGCYQRLEFLGDAVLDYLITSYLFSAFPDLKPGQLTDLRSSFVNNSSFARVAACALHKFIICESNSLRDAIDKYVNFIRKPDSERLLLDEPSCPKALGDLVESCIGAILLDAGFDLKYLWKVMLSFLDPVMKCSNLQLNPIRELLELSGYHGWDVEFVSSKRNKCFMVEAIVVGKNFCISGSSTYHNTKGAKRMASRQATEKLKAEGYQLKTKSLEEVLKTLRKREPELVGYDEIPLSLNSSDDGPYAGKLSVEDHVNTSIVALGNLTLNDPPNAPASPEPTVYEVPTNISSSQKKSTRTPSQQKHNQHTSNGISNVDADGPGKKSAKSRLNEICVKNCWKLPLYECCKEEGPSHLKVFTFKVMVTIEDAEDVILECFGKPKSKKKEAADEAAEGALWLLKKQGYIK